MDFHGEDAVVNTVDDGLTTGGGADAVAGGGIWQSRPAVVSVSSAVSFFADGVTAGGYTPRPGAAIRPGHSLP